MPRRGKRTPKSSGACSTSRLNAPCPNDRNADLIPVPFGPTAINSPLDRRRKLSDIGRPRRSDPPVGLGPVLREAAVDMREPEQGLRRGPGGPPHANHQKLNAL